MRQRQARHVEQRPRQPEDGIAGALYARRYPGRAGREQHIVLAQHRVNARTTAWRERDSSFVLCAGDPASGRYARREIRGDELWKPRALMTERPPGFVAAH